MRVESREPEVASRHTEAGFTLVEALVAIVILVFGLIAITNLMIVASLSNTTANHSTAATGIATEVMENLKGTRFEDLATGGGVDSDVSGFNRNDIVTGVGTIHTRWVVAAVNNQTRYLMVRSQSTSPLIGPRSRAEFTTFRSCTAVALGCPNP